MRVITWNVHGARKESPVWSFLSGLTADVILLQEVGGIPVLISENFDYLARPAINKDGKPQRFHTAILVKGKITDGFSLSSAHEWVNRELRFFDGNLVACTVQLPDCEPLKVVSVYCPAWPVNKDRLTGIELGDIKSSRGNPDVWATDILWDALTAALIENECWIVAGDFNSSETFDSEWQDRNNLRYGIRTCGCAEMLERMNQIGLTECLRKLRSDPIVPTFRHSRGGIHHQIDHLFVSNGLLSRLEKCTVGDQATVFGRSLSDHLPIIADFTQ